MPLTSFLKEAILFDLDGVLVDSRLPVERAWRNWALRHSLDPNLVIAAAAGRKSIDTVRQFAPGSDAQKETAQLEEEQASDIDGLAALPGARELLQRLSADRWAVCTSGTEKIARARLLAAGIPLPEILVSADQVVRGKPDPEPYIKTAQCLGVLPIACLVIEDSPAGILSAKTAGIHTVGLTTTHPPAALALADALAPDLSAISISLSGELLKIACHHPLVG